MISMTTRLHIVTRFPRSMAPFPLSVTPAQAGVSVGFCGDRVSLPPEIPASAGMTVRVGGAQ